MGPPTQSDAGTCDVHAQRLVYVTIITFKLPNKESERGQNNSHPACTHNRTVSRTNHVQSGCCITPYASFGLAVRYRCGPIAPVNPKPKLAVSSLLGLRRRTRCFITFLLLRFSSPTVVTRIRLFVPIDAFFLETLWPSRLGRCVLVGCGVPHAKKCRFFYADPVAVRKTRKPAFPGFRSRLCRDHATMLYSTCVTFFMCSLPLCLFGCGCASLDVVCVPGIYCTCFFIVFFFFPGRGLTTPLPCINLSFSQERDTIFFFFIVGF